MAEIKEFVPFGELWINAAAVVAKFGPLSDYLELEPICPVVDDVDVIKRYMNGDKFEPVVEDEFYVHQEDEEDSIDDYDEEEVTEEEDPLEVLATVLTEPIPEPEELLSQNDSFGYSSVTVNVSGGGGSTNDDVVFYDYDGSVVTPYSADDIIEEVTTSEPEVVVEEEPPVEVEKKTFKHTKESLSDVVYYIAQECNGQDIDTVVNDIVDKYGMSKRSAEKLVNQEAHLDLSLGVFRIVEGKISNDNIQYEDTLQDDDASVDKVFSTIMDNNGEIVKAITPNMSANDCIKIAGARLMMWKNGVFDSIGNGVKEVLAMDIAKNDITVNEVQNKFVNQYGLTIDKNTITAIRSGRSYQDIWRRFKEA